MTPLVERALENDPCLDAKSVEAGVQAALQAAKELLNEHEDKWYTSTDSSRTFRWLTLRGFSNDLYQIDKVAQT